MTKPILCAVPGNLPVGDVLEYYASKDQAFSCGYWSSDAVVIDVNYTEDEFCFLLEGQVRLTDASGAESLYSSGQGFVIPAGFIGKWESITPVRKFYVIYQPDI